MTPEREYALTLAVTTNKAKIPATLAALNNVIVQAQDSIAFGTGLGAFYERCHETVRFLLILQIAYVILLNVSGLS